MTKSRSPNQASKFRARAELLIQESVRKISQLPPADMRTLAHELHVHQMELEMQNDELRRIQLELEASHDHFSALYNFSPVGYLKLDGEGVIREANLTVTRQLNVDRAQMIGRKLAHFVAPDARDIYHLSQQKLREPGSREICTLKMLKRPGKNFMARTESIVLANEQTGAVEQLIAVSDITDQLQSEAAQAHFAAIVESSEDAIISYALDDIITSWNGGAEAMFGYTREQIIGRPISVLVQGEGREIKKIRQRIEAGERIRPFEALWIDRDGHEIAVSITASPLKDAHGRLLGISKIVRDISRQKEAEESLRESERKLTDFFNEAPLGLAWVRGDGQILKMNRAQLEFIGCDADEVIGRSIAEFIPDPYATTRLLERLARKQTIKDQPARLRIKNGELKDVLIDANGLWKNGRLVHSRWFVRDMTRQLELEREILAISEGEQRRIGQDLHDDLGQQLAGVEFAVQSLSGQLAPISKSTAKQLLEITRMVRRAMVHTRELAHGLSPLVLAADGLPAALRELAAKTKRIFRINCHFTSKGKVRIRDHAVGSHLYRIAQEAVNNAIKHGKARQIDIHLAARDGFIELTVNDNGIGMPKTLGDKKGLGLGIMRYRAGIIGGTLTTQSRPKGGTSLVCLIGNCPTLPNKKK